MIAPIFIYGLIILCLYGLSSFFVFDIFMSSFIAIINCRIFATQDADQELITGIS